jgi:hypothetical protein
MSLLAQITAIVFVTLLAGINTPSVLAQADDQQTEEAPDQEEVPDEPVAPPLEPAERPPETAAPQPATPQPVARPATLKLTNGGSYQSKVSLTYTLNGATIKALDEENLPMGWQREFEIPAAATTIHLEAYASTGLVWAKWGEILKKTWPKPTTTCITLTGTVLNRLYSEGCP